MNLDRQLPSSVDINIAPSGGTGVFGLVGGTGVPGGARWGDVCGAGVYAAGVGEFWAGDGYCVGCGGYLSCVGAGGPEARGEVAGVSGELDVVEGD